MVDVVYIHSVNCVNLYSESKQAYGLHRRAYKVNVIYIGLIPSTDIVDLAWYILYHRSELLFIPHESMPLLLVHLECVEISIGLAFE